MEADEIGVDGDPTDLTAGRFDEQLEQASQGNWEAIGLDGPDAAAQPGFVPASVDDFTGGT